MNLCSDDRAQSLQVGAVLLFGFIILALTIFQAEAVPEENKEVEFDHSQEVAEDMVGFYTAIFETVIEGEPRTASITLGTDYNDRLFFIYPPPASGALQTTEPRQLQLHNVTAVEDPDTNQSFDNYWRNETRNYTTRAITYSANYRELTGTADYRIEYGVLAAQYPSTTQLRLADSHQPIVSDMNKDDKEAEIDLVLVDGDLQKISPDTEPVIPQRVTDSTRINVTNATNTSSITLDLPTGLPAENWNTSNPDSMLYEQPAVDNVTVNERNVSVQLNSSFDYNLTLHKVDVGSAATEPEPTYIRNVSYDGTESTFQVRDEYNDLADETVKVSVYNTTGGTYNITRNISVLEGVHTFEPNDPTGVDDECGVSLLTNVSNTSVYERLNVTDSC